MHVAVVVSSTVVRSREFCNAQRIDKRSYMASYARWNYDFSYREGSVAAAKEAEGGGAGEK